MIKFNNKTAYLSRYVPLEENPKQPETYIPKTIRLQNNNIISIDFHPDIVKLLRSNNIKFDIIEHCSFR